MNQLCKNCNHTFKGNFCNQCGQKAGDTAFTFRHIFHEAFHAFTHADKGVLVLIKKLALNPGKVGYEYIVEGKRKKYFNLFTFFVLITAIAAFVENKDLAIKETLFHENNEYGHVFNVYSKLLTIIAIPLIALVTWLIHYKKTTVRYSEYTVFAMLLMSVSSIIDIVVATTSYLSTLLFKSYSSPDENLFFLLFMILFTGYANYQFHKPMKTSSWWQSILTGIGFCLVQAAILLFVIWAILRHFDGLGIFYMYGVRL